MRFLLGIIVFWCSAFGIMFFIKEKTNIKSAYLLPLTFTMIGIIMFIAGILNIMKITTIVTALFGIIELLLWLYRKYKDGKISAKLLIRFIKENKKDTIIYLIEILIFIYITIIGFNTHIMHYDNFSHWGLIVQSMFKTNSLPNFESIIMFKSYQPGSACFIYYLGALCGKGENTMIIAQNYLILSFITILFNMVKNKKVIILSLLLLLYPILMYAILINFNDLLVDSLIAVMFLGVILLIYDYKNDLKHGIIFATPFLIYLLLVKNAGILFAGFAYLYILILLVKNKEFKSNVKYLIVSGAIFVLFFLIWQGHVSLVFGANGLSSKHSLSVSNIMSNIENTGPDNIAVFIKKYLYHLIEIVKNKPAQYMIGLNAMGIILIALSKKKKKTLLIMMTIDALFITYYIALGGMYILSMPWNEAKRLACYDRYVNTIIIALIGIFIAYLFINWGEIKWNYAMGIILVLAIGFVIYSNQKNILSSVGQDGYRESNVEKYDRIKKFVPKKDGYYVYSTKSKNDYGFLRYLSIYKLWTRDVIVVDDIQNVEKKEYNTVVLMEPASEEVLNDLGYTKLNEYVFVVK